MALHNLKIVVIDGGRSDSCRSKNVEIKEDASNKNNKDTPLYKLLNAKKTIKNKVQSGMTPASVFAMDMGTRVIGQAIKQTANYFISDIGRSNGDSNYQASINRDIEIITEPLSIVGGALSGATAGSMFGPIGMGVGLVLGTIGSSISLGFKYAERNRSYQHEMFKENTSQAHKLSRANYSIHTGRLR